MQLSNRNIRRAALGEIPGALCGLHRAAVLFIALAAVAPAQAKRVALVIGNDSYQHADPLVNARADAKAVAEALRATNFQVTLKLDLTLNQMKEAVRNLKSDVSGGDEVIFYYSGHGVQIDGNNFLIPVDTDGRDQDQIKDDSVELQHVLDVVQDQKAKFTLAIIDACRDNPFKGNGRGLRTRGLQAAPTGADGQAVIYSAGTGQEALDNLGPGDKNPNGVFTRVLITEMRKPGEAIDQVMRNVARQVKDMSTQINHPQSPAIYNQFTGDFYFIPPAAGQAPAGAPLQAVPEPPARHVQTAAEREQEFWDRIQDSTDPADFADYAKNFPQGPHAGEAAVIQRKLQRQAAAAAPAPAVSVAARPAAKAFVAPPEDADPAWVPFDDPAEHGFRLQVPKGWRVAGGTYRFGTVDDPRIMVEMISPDGAVRLRVGDAGVPPFVAPNLALKLQGLKEGSRYTQNGAQAIVANYRSGWMFADLYGQARFASFCSNLELKQLRELPSVNENNGQSKNTAGEAIFRCEGSAGEGPMVGFVVAETQLQHLQALDVWKVGPLYSALAPESLGAAALKIILHVSGTHATSQQWAMYQLKQRGVTGTQANQVFQMAVAQETLRHQRLDAQFQQQADGLTQAMMGATLTSNVVDHSKREIWNAGDSNNIVSPMGAVASLTAYRNE